MTLSRAELLSRWHTQYISYIRMFAILYALEVTFYIKKRLFDSYQSNPIFLTIKKVFKDQGFVP